MWPFKPNPEKELEKILDRSFKAYKGYSVRQMRYESLDRFVRWCSEDGDDPVSLPAAEAYLAGRRDDARNAQKQMRKNALTEMLRQKDTSTTTPEEVEVFSKIYMNKAQQIPDDTEIVINGILFVLEQIDYSQDGLFMDIVRRERDKAELDHIEHFQWMCCEIQRDIEKIKILAGVGTQSAWDMAGDIAIPMWENLFERGIKHEIAMRVKPGMGDAPDEAPFDNKDAFSVYTREEMEEQIRKAIDATRR